MHALLVLRQFFFVCIFVSVYVAVFPTHWRFVGKLWSFAHNGCYYKTVNQCMQYALSDLLCSFEFRLYVVKSKFTDAFEKQLPRNIDPQLHYKAGASGVQQTDAIVGR